MVDVLGYRSPSPEALHRARPSWLAYALYFLPAAITLLLCFSSFVLPEFIVAHFAHPATPFEGWRLQWRWEDSFKRWAGYSLLPDVGEILLLVAIFLVPPLGDWLRNRTPGWVLVIPVNLAASVLCSIVISRGRP